MIADATARDSRTNGFWGHTGRLVVSRRLDTGELMSVTLPDDVGAGGGPTIPDGSITSAMIADGAIVAADLADGAVTTPKIANGAVTTAKLNADVHPTAAEFNALVARVAALEAIVVPDSLEDMTYGG